MTGEMGTRRYTFRKDERLCSKVLIDKLFTEGTTVYSFPFRFVFIMLENKDTNHPAQVVFSVPRKNFKKAVDRNLIRRKMRETFRHEKYLLYDPLLLTERNMALMIIYTQKEIPSYNAIYNPMVKGMKKLISKIGVSH